MPAKKTQTVSADPSAAETKTAKNAKRAQFWICFYWILIVAATMIACYALTGVEFRTTGAASELTEEPLRGNDGTDASATMREDGKQKLLDGDVVGALNDFTLAIEADPDAALNYIYRGEVLMSGSNYDAALADFDAAIRIEPSVVAYYDRAIANMKLENLAAAKLDLDRALDGRGPYPEAGAISDRDIYSKRAQVNLWLRNWADADADYTAAIALDSEADWNDYTGRAEARTSIGDYENAVQDYISAVTIISERIQRTPDGKSRENMSRQAMGFFEKSGALRVKLGQMDMALQDLQAAHTLAIALDDMENKNRLQVLMSSIQ